VTRLPLWLARYVKFMQRYRKEAIPAVGGSSDIQRDVFLRRTNS
jgi:hypothetical protein